MHSSRDQVLRHQGVATGTDPTDPSVDWEWLCDRGRFDFESIDVDARLGEPLVRTEAGLQPTTWSTALGIAKQLVESAGSIGLVGGARSTNEGAFAWAQLADAVGIRHRDAQVGDGLPAAVLGLPRATIDEAVAAPTVVLLAPDLKEELPVLYLRLRAAAEQRLIQALASGIRPAEGAEAFLRAIAADGAQVLVSSLDLEAP